MLEETFSQGNSLLHHADPRAKLVTAILLVFAMATLKSLLAATASFIICLMLVLTSRLPVGKVFKRILIVNGFIIFLWVFLPFSTPGRTLFIWWCLKASVEGVKLAGLITLKSNAILLAIIALITTTSVPLLGQALACLKIPEKFSTLLLITYRYLNLIQDEYNCLSTAAKIRGFIPATNMHTYRTYAYLLAMVLIKSYDRAQRVYQAMLLRGFNGRFYSLHEFHFCDKDIYLSSCLILCAAGLIILDYFSETVLNVFM